MVRTSFMSKALWLLFTKFPWVEVSVQCILISWFSSYCGLCIAGQLFVPSPEVVLTGLEPSGCPSATVESSSDSKKWNCVQAFGVAAVSGGVGQLFVCLQHLESVGLHARLAANVTSINTRVCSWFGMATSLLQGLRGPAPGLSVAIAQSSPASRSLGWCRDAQWYRGLLRTKPWWHLEMLLPSHVAHQNAWDIRERCLFSLAGYRDMGCVDNVGLLNPWLSGSEQRWHCHILKRDITVISYLLTLQLELWWHLVLVEQVRTKRGEKLNNFLPQIP